MSECPDLWSRDGGVREKRKMEGGSDRNENERPKQGEEAEAWEGEEKRGYLVRGHR